jgi:crossover junction endodeoxyribonuclease RuvC
MRILGIDPGSLKMGWGVLETTGTRMRHVSHGIVRLPPDTPLADRLVLLERAMIDLLATYAPDEASIESTFFGKDASAATKLGHARGVIVLCVRRAGIALFEYAPARVKKDVGGGGRAQKAQVAQLVTAILGLKAVPSSDAADALALAITHHYCVPLRQIHAALDAAIAKRPKPKAPAQKRKPLIRHAATKP